MEVKRDIIWRVHLCFLGMVAFGAAIFARAVYIQRAEGSYWLEQARKRQQKFVEIEADRGTIYSEKGEMLSTSVPYFDIYIDFMADGLREKNGRRFRENLDSLSICLANLFRDRTAGQYKRLLQSQYNKKNRYFLLKRNISFDTYRQLREFPLVRLGKNRSGFIAEVRNKRLNPYGLLANRTIGLARDYMGSDGSIRHSNVGLELTYDSLLRGQSGRKLVRFIGGGAYVPVEGGRIEPVQGKDIVTNLDVHIQDIAEEALLRMMQENEAVHGTCIVMEVRTGKVRAMANLGRNPDGTYWENLNYGILASEPGSTFKLATMLALLEDGHADTNTRVDLEKGSWRVGSRTVFDSERHGRNEVSLREAFGYSSNVAMAKLISAAYRDNPEGFLRHLRRLRLHEPTGIDLVGETMPVIKTPSSRTWSKTTLPWMSFGYELLISPLQTLTLYNAVANEGRMLQPYLVQAVTQGGVPAHVFEPRTLQRNICSRATLRRLQDCLVAACHERGGTGYRLFEDAPYRVAGKTGTALVANGSRGYADRIYQSSFVGYFPANDPVYSCIVVIRNKPHARKFYGASVAGPVFREVADKLYALYVAPRQGVQPDLAPLPDGGAPLFRYAGATEDLKRVTRDLGFALQGAQPRQDFAVATGSGSKAALQEIPLEDGMPDLRGMGLKDALYLLESRQVRVVPSGSGRVTEQSLPPGTALAKGSTVYLRLQ